MYPTRSKRAVIVRISVLSAAIAALGAAPITGSVNLNGVAGVSGGVIDFYGLGSITGCNNAGPGTDGCFVVSTPVSGDFTSLVGTQGAIKDLQSPPLPISGFVVPPLTAWMTFSNGYTFDLTRILAGGAPDCAVIDPNAPNATCTPYIGGVASPFVLTNSSNGQNASVFFNVEVNGYTGSSATGTTAFVGAFNTPSAGQNISTILATIGSGNYVSAAFSANFVGTAGPEIPEPATATMLGLGLAGVILGGLRARPKRG